ncbi:hypothetical protein AMECASPLE_000241 [Ameca splendens]|uniref:Uncharacterized protein n=1 Tax=Ameca splendens TaxID=208324 RepID=A0ABV0ZTU3_9TELE
MECEEKKEMKELSATKRKRKKCEVVSLLVAFTSLQVIFTNLSMADLSGNSSTVIHCSSNVLSFHMPSLLAFSFGSQTSISSLHTGTQLHAKQSA